jgi:hypothetical protein
MTLVRLENDRLGWRRDGEIAASASVRRDGDDLVVEHVEQQDEESGRALVDALAGMATLASRVVDAEGRVLRDITVAPVESPMPLTLARLEQAIRASWSAETSDRPREWSEENPSFQQCDATSRVVRDYLGGEILVAGVVLDGRRVDMHAWNRLPSGVEVDLSREQFLQGEQFETPRVLTEFVGDRFEERYELLAARVRERLSS